MNDGKTLRYFQKVHELFKEYPFDFVFKADDDTMLHLPHIYSRFQSFPRESVYWGKTCWRPFYMCGA